MMKIFAIGRSKTIAERVCDELDIRLSVLLEEKFPDGEIKIRPVEGVQDADVYVLHSLGHDSISSTHDKICELYFLLSCLKDQGAASLTLCIPYFSYARSDQRKETFDPLTNRYLAELFELVHLKRIIALDIHNISAFENAYRCPVFNLEATSLFIKYIHATLGDIDNITVLSPDIGGIKRAEKFKRLLELIDKKDINLAFVEKYRTTKGLSGHQVSGEIGGQNIFILDDMISTGGTILKAMDACHKEGAASVRVFSSHGIFSSNRDELLKHPLIEEVIVTDSHSVMEEIDRIEYPKLKTLACSPLFAHMIKLLGGTVEDFSLRRRDDREGNRPGISLLS